MRPRRYDSRLEAFLDSPAKKKLEQRARLKDADLRPILRSERAIIFYPQGNLVRIEGSNDYEPHERGSARRGKIGSFSARSRSRLMTLCSMLNKASLPLFLTLTWPGIWSPEPKEWKACLDTFCKRLKRAHPNSSAIWKLEPQERGAPHYHLLVFGVSFIPHETISRWWFEVVGSGDKRHLAAGIRIEAVRTREGVMQYASKLYMGKEIAGFSGVGRFWGIFNRSKLPRSVEMREDVAECVVVKFQRIARRLIQSQTKARFLRKLRAGRRVKWRRFRCNRPTRIFANDPAQFGRLLDWAEEKHYDDLALAGQPF